MRLFMVDNEISKHKRVMPGKKGKNGRPIKALPVPLLADPNKPIRNLSQTTDLAAFFAYHVASGGLTVSQSRELRHWVDLMMTSIIAQKIPEENTSSSVIHVLHSLANASTPEAIDITPVVALDSLKSEAS
jgi:hypothetical protein